MMKLKLIKKIQIAIISSFLIITCSCKTGLIGYYPFDENANDYSVNRNNGIVEGATLSADRNSKPNSSYYFDGIDDYIMIKNFGDVIQTKEITICFWVKSLVSKPQFQFMLSPDNNRFAISINYFHDRMNTTFWDFGWQGEGGNAPGRLYFRPEPIDTLWHHYAFVSSITENSMKIYKDKALLVEKNEPKELLNPVGKNLMIGSGDHSFFFKGYIDEIKIYNKILSAKEIEKL